jgi:hypothetical protein
MFGQGGSRHPRGLPRVPRAILAVPLMRRVPASCRFLATQKIGPGLVTFLLALGLAESASSCRLLGLRRLRVAKDPPSIAGGLRPGLAFMSHIHHHLV